ncbi:conserved hypothetical protein [Echinococcus multilocularis]|uniref:Uncharacterized protein n=1 Tax=Echinococcus multilocularis TaxID=6211 RepID=A0A068Y0X0_ECHMU|nr:conserved hypothetical protein [Echinococcus multilocularis]
MEATSTTSGKVVDEVEDQEGEVQSDLKGAVKASQTCRVKFRRSGGRRHSTRNNNFTYEKTGSRRSFSRRSLPSYVRSKFATMRIGSGNRLLCGPQSDLYREYCNTKEEEEETVDDLTSHIYVTSSIGVKYRVTFTAENATLEPLFILPRNSPPTQNEKINQITSRMKVYEDPGRLNYVAVKRPKFSLIESTMSEKPAPPVQVYISSPITPKKGVNSISRPEKTHNTGLIYINTDGFILKVRIPPLSIKKVRHPITKEVRSTMERLRMPCSEEYKNKARLLVRLGNDLFRVYFDLIDCIVTRLSEHKSLAVQTENHMIIRQFFSHFTNKRVNLQLPESTYVYHDPMVEIRRVNHYFANLNIAPLWKYQMYQKRITQMREHTTLEGEIGKVLKRARGSTVTFDGFDTIVTAIGGLMHGIVVRGDDAYEAKIHTFLGDEKKPETEELISDWRYEEGDEEMQGEANVNVNSYRPHLWENEEVEETLESMNMPSTVVN